MKLLSLSLVCLFARSSLLDVSIAHLRIYVTATLFTSDVRERGENDRGSWAGSKTSHALFWFVLVLVLFSSQRGFCTITPTLCRLEAKFSSRVTLFYFAENSFV